METRFDRTIGDDWPALHRRICERYGLTTGDSRVAVGRGVICEMCRRCRAVPARYLATADDVLPQGWPGVSR